MSKKPLEAFISVGKKVYRIGNAEEVRELLKLQRSGGVFKIEGLGTLVIESIRPNFKGSHIRLLYVTRQVSYVYRRKFNRRGRH